MTGLRLELANPDGFDSPKDYIEKHLAPVVTELHRVVNELMVPGSSSAEEWQTDSIPAFIEDQWRRFSKPLVEVARHVNFDGSQYFSVPKELLKTKQVKVQLTAVVYSEKADVLSRFRLVDEQGEAIDNSEFTTGNDTPTTFTRILPFGEMRGSIHPSKITYYLEGRSSSARSVRPVCRRFSLSFVYI